MIFLLKLPIVNVFKKYLPICCYLLVIIIIIFFSFACVYKTLFTTVLNKPIPSRTIYGADFLRVRFLEFCIFFLRFHFQNSVHFILT